MARLSRITVLLLAGVALASCGGDDEANASEDYANSVCSSLSAWVTDVQETVTSLTDEGLAIEREDIDTAVDQAKESTESLAEDLEGLGAPETEDGTEAKSELDSLVNTVEQQIATVEEALSSGGAPASIAATVTAAIATAASAVETTYENVQGLDPSGELSEAFEDSEECDSLQEQLDELGSDEGES